MSATAMARFTPLPHTAILTAHIQLIQSRRGTVGSWILFLIVGCVRQATSRSHRVHLLWLEFVLHLRLVAYNRHIRHLSGSVHFGFLVEAVLNVAPDEFGH